VRTFVARIALRSVGSAPTPLHQYRTTSNCDPQGNATEQLTLQFVKYWKRITGLKPDWLYFDGKMTTYAIVDQLREDNVNFITVRRRGARFVRNLLGRPADQWLPAVIDTPQRRGQLPTPG